jgi:hypothetical protein
MATSRDELKKVLLDLLKTDESLRAEVYSLVVEAPITKREIESLTREIRNLAETMTKRMDSFEKSLELMIKRMDSFEKNIVLMTERMDRFDEEMRKSREEFRVISSALGARWGFAAEESFREAIRGILESMGFTVSKWEVYDDEGVVFGAPGVVEVDVLIRDREHILIEIKSNMGKSDVAALTYKAKLYEKLVGVKPSLVIVSPFVEEDAKQRAVMEKIKVYTRVREFKPV